MQSFGLAPHARTKSEKAVLLTLLAISGAALLAIAIFYVLNPRAIVGDQLVNSPTGGPEEIPSPKISPVYVKPVTLLFVAGVVFSYCFFVLAQGLISKYMPRFLRYFLLVISITLLAAGLYEVLFNFTLFGALMTSGAAPNTLVNPYPIGGVKTNLVYATKATLLWVIVAFFSTVAFKNSLETKD
jgi:cytochrome c biogenesis protein CcdA